jgi:hypothetical protein
MKKLILSAFFVVLISLFIFPQTNDIKLGRIYFPKAFVHAGKDYNKGTYKVEFTVKDEVPLFKVFDKKNNLLFEELAVIKPFEGKNKKFKYRVKKELLKVFLKAIMRKA